MSLYTLLRIIQISANGKTESQTLNDNPTSDFLCTHSKPLPVPKAAVLMSMGSGIDIVTNQEYHPNDLPREIVGADDVAASKWMRNFWVNDIRNVDFLKSLSKYIPTLPPVMVTVGEYEILAGLVRGAAELFKASNVDVNFKEYSKMIHCHIDGCSFGVPEAWEIINDISHWIKMKFTL